MLLWLLFSETLLPRLSGQRAYQGAGGLRPWYRPPPLQRDVRVHQLLVQTPLPVPQVPALVSITCTHEHTAVNTHRPFHEMKPDNNGTQLFIPIGDRHTHPVTTKQKIYSFIISL